MKRFKFRYQTLLEVRERAEKLEEEVLQRHLGSLAKASGAMEELMGQERAQQAAWIGAQGQAGGVDLDNVAMIQRFLVVLDQRIGRQRAEVEQAEARVANQRELLAEARRQAEVIRQLKERDQKAWREELERAEARELDELATLRYAHRQRGAF